MVQDLNELADRCEAASGPDKELDWAIEAAVGDWENLGGARKRHKGTGEVRTGYVDPQHPYTASIDSAMTLIPGGMDFGCGRGIELEIGPSKEVCHAWVGEGSGDLVFAETPALALCAAALRAKAHP